MKITRYFYKVSVFIIFLLLSCTAKKKIPLDEEIRLIETGLLPAVYVSGKPVLKYELAERMAYYNVPGISIAVVKSGKLHWAKGYGLANEETCQEVNENTLFQAGSISKPVAALAALKLWEEGKVDLDTDVNQYLTGWQIPENEFTGTEKVTLRRLLTHTAGVTVHGFPGYPVDKEIPVIEQVLNGEGNTAPVIVDRVPGSHWRYSGGGYTVMEKTVEDISGIPFEQYMQQYILNPLGMNQSTYSQPLPEHLFARASAAFDHQGKMIKGLWHNYPEKAAAGLWTTPSDLARYCIAIQEIISGKGGILSHNTIQAMLTKDKNDWGLGPSLKWEADSLIFMHGGKNAGFTNDMISFANKGNAVIIMTNGDNGGGLIKEILRSLSDYYQWNIHNQKIISEFHLPPGEINKLTGKYQYVDHSDFELEVKYHNNQLILINRKGDTMFRLILFEKLKFIDPEKGDEIYFSEDPEGKPNGMVWNDRYRFVKIE